MRNRLDEAYSLTMGKFAVIILGTAILISGIYQALPWRGIGWFTLWILSLIANYFGL